MIRQVEINFLSHLFFNFLIKNVSPKNNLNELEYRMETKIPAGIYIVRVALEEGQIIKKIRVD